MAVLSTFSGDYQVARPLSSVVNNFPRSMEAEVGYIKRQQARGKARQIVESTQDQGNVIKHYRRIELLFHKLQVSCRSIIPCA